MPVHLLESLIVLSSPALTKRQNVAIDTAKYVADCLGRNAAWFCMFDPSVIATVEVEVSIRFGCLVGNAI